MVLFAGPEYANEELLKPFNEKFQILFPHKRDLPDFNSKVNAVFIFNTFI